MRRARAILVAAFACATVMLPALSAEAASGPIITKAAKALQSTHVYVASDASTDPAATLSKTQQQVLESMIRGGDHPLYIAVLPASVQKELAGGDAAVLAPDVRDATGLPGVYAVIAGPVFRAATTSDSAGVPPALAMSRQAYDQHHKDGVYATLLAFTKMAESYQAPNSASNSNSNNSGVTVNNSGTTAAPAVKESSHTMRTVIVVIIVLAMLAIFVAVLVSMSRSSRRRKEEAMAQRNRGNPMMPSSFDHPPTRAPRGGSYASTSDADPSERGRGNNTGRTTQTTHTTVTERVQPQMQPSGIVNPMYSSYGYYPGMGYGYYGSGGFIEGVIAAELLEDAFGGNNNGYGGGQQDVNVTVNEPDQSGQQDNSGSTDDGSSGGGSFDDSSGSSDSGDSGGGSFDDSSSQSWGSDSGSDSSYDSGSSGYDSGGGGFDSGGSSYDSGSSGFDSGGGGFDSGGGGDSGGGW